MDEVLARLETGLSLQKDKEHELLDLIASGNGNPSTTASIASVPKDVVGTLELNDLLSLNVNAGAAAPPPPPPVESTPLIEFTPKKAPDEENKGNLISFTNDNLINLHAAPQHRQT